MRRFVRQKLHMVHPLFPWFGKKKSAPEPVVEPVAEVAAAEPAVAPEGDSGKRRGKRSYSFADPFFWQYFNLGSQNLAGVDVTQRTAMGVPPFFAAVRYISEGVAMLDRKVKIRKPEGVFDAVGHPVWKSVMKEPHPYYTWNDLICAALVNACLGNGYIRIHWDYSTMRPGYFEHLPSIFTTPYIDDRGNLWFDVTGTIGGRTVIERLPYTDVIHIKGPSLDGITGLNTIITHESVLSTGIARQQYSESVLGKGARPSIAIKTQDELDENEVDAIEQNVMNRIGGAANAGRPLVLDAGQDIQYIQWSPLEAALEALSNLNVEDVCRMTKVPRDLMALDTSGTYGAGVQRSKDFLTHCLNPWIEKFQEEFNRKAFWYDELEMQTVWFEFDTSMYVALDEKTKSEKLVKEVAGTVRTPNEARAELGLPPVDGGDELMVDINLLPMSKAVEVALAKYLSAQGEKIRKDAGDDLGGELQNDTENEPDDAKSKSAA